MEKEKILTLPPSLNECKKLNIIFPSSAPSKDIYINGLQILENEIKKRYSETSDVEIYVNNIIANKISQHPNFCGIKECMGSERIQYYSDKNIITWSGNDDECHDTRHMNGCNGVISVTSNILPGLFRKMMDEPNPEIRDKTIKLVNYLFVHPNPIAINTLMAMLGLCKPVFRLPYIEYNKDMRLKLKNLVDEISIEHFLSHDGKCRVLENSDFIHV